MDFLDGMLGGGLNSSRKNTTTNTSNNTNSNGRSKICRSASELDMEQTSGAQDWRSPAGSASSIKMPRTDSYPALMRTSSVISEANNAHSTNSDFLEDSRGLLRSSDASGVSPYARSCLPFCHQQQQQQQLGAYPQYSNNGSVNAIRSSSGGMPLLMGASAGGVGMGMGMGMNAILRSPFTASQWQELEHQALIFKYILARAPVPSELLIPLRTKSNSLNIFSSLPLTGSSIRPTLGWNSYHLGFANNADPEPGRCRRTDGKKWRCSRDAVPDQKYCERHMNRGRHRSRKPVEGQTTTTTIATTNATAATASPSNNHVVSSSPAASNAASLASATARPAGGLTSPNVNATSLSAHSSQTNALRSCSLVPQHHQNEIGAAAATQLTKLSSFSSAMASSASNFQMPLNVDGFMGGGVLKGDVRTGHIFESSTGLSMMTSHSNTSSSTTQAQEAAAAATNVASAWRSRMTAATRGATTATTTTIATSSDQNVLSYDANDLAHMNLFHHPQNPRADDSDSPGIRHFFDDWPGSRERSVHWPNANSATHLSISVNSPGGGGSSPEKITLSPLKLSMSGRDDPLGMELGLANDNETASGDDHRQRPTANWIPITWESSVGGPLAEVLNNTATGNSREFKNSLNLMTDGWECTGSPRGDGSRMASPTGVLQKTTFGSLSDSSTGSSPRAVVVKPESSGGGLTTGAFCENVRSASAFNPAAPISTS